MGAKERVLIQIIIINIIILIIKIINNVGTNPTAFNIEL
jgi:hypothetical protein